MLVFFKRFKWRFSVLLRSCLGLLPCNVIISHGDVDGIISAALVRRHLRKDAYIIFTSPRNLSDTLSLIRGRKFKLYLTDLALNLAIAHSVADRLRNLKDKGCTITWIDHHTWSTEAVEAVKPYVDSLVVREETSAAKLVMEFLSLRDPFSVRLVEIADDADTARYELKISRMYRSASRSTWLKRKIVDLLVDGKLMSEEIEKNLERYDNADVKLDGLSYQILSTLSGRKFAVFDFRSNPGPVSCIVRALCQKEDLDFVLIIFNFKKFSLYRCQQTDDIDLRRICESYGGGGHTFACGGVLEVPLRSRIISFFRSNYRPKELDNLVKDLIELL